MSARAALRWAMLLTAAAVLVAALLLRYGT
jgi:hypothetical protein